MPDFFLQFFNGFDLGILAKVPFLVVIGLYAIFALIVFNKSRSLGKIVFIENSSTTPVITFLAFLHLLAVLLLFLLALVIL